MGELSYTVGGDSNLVSFKSAARVPITSLKAHFKPKQDLHGYSKPWVGGSGKNLLNISVNNVIGLASSESSITITNTGFNFGNSSALLGFLVEVTPNTNYTYSYISTYNGSNMHARVYGTSEKPETWTDVSNGIKLIDKTSWTGSATFTTDNDTRWLVVGAYAYDNGLNASLTNMQLEKGSTATSYEPYENICPIEGWSSAKIYTTGEELPFVGIPGITDSLGVHFVVDNNGIITADGTPTSFSQVMCKKYVVNGDEILYGRIIGNLKNVTNVMPQLYDENGTRLHYGKFGDDLFNTYLDLKQYPGVKTVIVGVKRLSNGIPVTGQGTFVLTKGSQKPVNSIPITFPITGKNLFNFNLSTSSLVKMDYHDDIFQNNATDTRTVPNLQVQLMQTVTSYIKTGGSSFPSTTGRTSFQFVVDSEECKYVRFKHNGAVCDLGVCVPFEYGLGTYTISFDLLGTDPSTVGGFSFKDIQIERGTTATAYEPYSSDNTFYGGYIDPAAGEAQPMWYLYTITGDETFYDGGAWVSAFVPAGLYASSIDGLKNVGYCTHYQYAAYKSNKIGVMYDERTITFDASVRTATEWKAFCKAEYEKGTPVQVCYPLKSYLQSIPIKKNNITSFINTNNVWSNTNSNTEVSYAIHDTAPIRATKKRMAAENDKHYRKVLWNQWAPVVNASNYRAYNSTNTTMTVEDDVIVQVWNKVVSGYSASICTADSWVKTHIMGRVYYLSYEYCTDFEGYIGGTVGGQTFFSSTLTEKNIWNRFSFIIRRTDGGGMNNNVVYMGRFNNTTGIEVGSQCLLRNPIAIDLTQMFGNGNEPKTKADFERLCAINNIDLYSYHPRDTGTEQMWCIPHATSDEYIKVNWNQQCKELTTSNYKPQNSNYASISAENGVMTTTILQDVSEIYQSSFISNYSIEWDSTHQYYYKQEINSSTNSTYYLIYKSRRGSSQTLLSNTWTTLEAIASPESTDSTPIFLAYNVDKAIGGVAEASCQVRNPILIDLTKMFGAGNEPTTVAELRATCLKNNINLDNTQPYISSTTIMWKK